MNVACVADGESGSIDLGEVLGERGQVEKTSCDTLIVTYSEALAWIRVDIVSECVGHTYRTRRSRVLQ